MFSKLLTALTIVLNKSRKLRALVIPFLSASTNLAMNWWYQEVINWGLALIAFACSYLISIFISIKCTDWREKIQFQASYWSAGDFWEEQEESYNHLCALCCPPCMTESYRVGMRYFYKKGSLAGAMFLDWPVFVRIYLVPSCWRGRILDQDCLEESVAFSTRFLSLQSDPSKQSKQAFSLNPNSWQGSTSLGECSRKTISEGRDLCPLSSGQVFKLKRLLFHSSPAIN